MNNKLIALFSLSVLLLALLVAGCKSHSSSPFSESAENALSTFKLPPGFKIELVAAEPLISDPVDMTIDEEGTYVCSGNARLSPGYKSLRKSNHAERYKWRWKDGYTNCFCR